MNIFLSVFYFFFIICGLFMVKSIFFGEHFRTIKSYWMHRKWHSIVRTQTSNIYEDKEKKNSLNCWFLFTFWSEIFGRKLINRYCRPIGSHCTNKTSSSFNAHSTILIRNRFLFPIRRVSFGQFDLATHMKLH